MSCSEKTRLMVRLGEAMKRIIELDNEEMEALIRGDLSADPALEAQLREARKIKDSIFIELKSHTRQHGC